MSPPGSPTVIGDLRDPDQGPSAAWHDDAGVRRARASIAAEYRWLATHAVNDLSDVEILQLEALTRTGRRDYDDGS